MVLKLEIFISSKDVRSLDIKLTFITLSDLCWNLIFISKRLYLFISFNLNSVSLNLVWYKVFFSSNRIEIKEINSNKSNTNKLSIRSKAKQRASLIKQKNPEKIKKPYIILKKIMEYLESNNITLFEIIKHNPFHKKPYQISKSFEFLKAVKFKNYNYFKIWF